MCTYFIVKAFVKVLIDKWNIYKFMSINLYNVFFLADVLLSFDHMSPRHVIRGGGSKEKQSAFKLNDVLIIFH